MTDLNTITVIGNLVKDGETRVSPSGTYFSRFTVASNEKTRERESVSFIPCVLFGKLAEVLGASLRKGTKIAVSGRLASNNYEKDGVKRYELQVKVDNLQILSKRDHGEPTRFDNPPSRN